MGIYDRDWYRATLRKRQRLPSEDGRAAIRRAAYAPRAHRTALSTRTPIINSYWWTAIGWFGTGWITHKHWPAIVAFFRHL